MDDKFRCKKCGEVSTDFIQEKRFKCVNCSKIYWVDSYEGECYQNASNCKECRDLLSKKAVREYEFMEKERKQWYEDFIKNGEFLKKVGETMKTRCEGFVETNKDATYKETDRSPIKQ